MIKLKIFLFLIFLVLGSSCSKETIQKSTINEKSLDLQVLEAYQGGLEALDDGDVLYAAKKFNEAEILYPQSIWAPRAALMAAYSYYFQDYYGDAVAELERFIKVYPKHENLDYAYFLLATSYYEQIVDEKKDLQYLSKAKENFLIVIDLYPNTDYAIDASFKLDLINDILAAKEMYIGRYYIDKKKWISAINRFRNVVDNYETTAFTQEALHRLVEIYFILGLEDEAQKYAKLLGYNYQSGEWYKKSYKVFNKNYEMRNVGKIKKEKKGVISKFKKLFE